MSKIDLLSDESLMKEYQRGREEAFVALYKRHAPRVYGFLLKRLRDRSLSDDTFQAVFLKVHQNRKNYDASLPFTPWLFTICKSVMIDGIRKSKRNLVVLNDFQIDQQVNQPLNQVNTGTPGELPEPPTLPSLSPLSEEQRRAIQYRYASDLSFEETAKQMNTTSANVRQLTSRAVRKLRSIVKDSSDRRKKQRQSFFFK